MSFTNFPRDLSRLSLLLVLTGVLAAPTVVTAQNTGGIFPPMVNEGHKSLQYRITLDPDTDDYAQRIHYQQAINGDLMWRVVGQYRTTDAAGTDFDYAQGELFWHLSEDGDPWQTGLRFDARVRSHDRPGLLGLNWTNQFRLTDKWNARFIALSAVDIGNNSRDGVFLQTRGSLAYAAAPATTVGLQIFSSYGSTSDLLGSDEQIHQVGPFVTFPVADKWRLFFDILLGVTDASPDEAFRFWWTRSF